MSAYNLQTYLEEMRGVLTGGAYQRDSIYLVPDAVLTRFLNRGLDYCQDRLRVFTMRDTSLTLTSGTQTYTIPSDILGRGLTGVHVLDSTGTDWGAPLEPLEWDTAMRAYNLANPETGTPRAFAYNPANPRQLYLFPQPDYTIANGIALDYQGRAPELKRIYLQTSITAEVTLNSTTVTLSSSVASVAYKPQATDAFGVCVKTNNDATVVTANATPGTWYEVSTFNGTTGITLTSAYLEATGSGKTFITAQVSALERTVPGKMMMAPAWMGLYFHFIASGQKDKAMDWKAMADEILDGSATILPGAVRNSGPSPAALFGPLYFPDNGWIAPHVR